MVADELFASVAGLHPPGKALVELGARALRDTGVGDISDQRVPEAEAVLSRDARHGRLDEVTANELEQRRPEGRVPAVEGCHRPRPELLADDGRPLEHVPLLMVETVEARCEESLDRRRQGHELQSCTRLLGEHRHELLGVERIALGDLGHACAQLRRQDAVAIERLEKLGRLPTREWLESHAHALPLGSLFEQLLAGDAEDEDRRVAAPAAHMLDEVEHGRLRPVDVLEHDQERAGSGEAFEEAPHRPEQLLGRRGALAAEHAQALDDECGVGFVAHRVRYGSLAAEVPDQLCQRPERDPVAVGEAATGGDGGVVANLGDQFRDEASLADPGRADQRDQPAPALVRARRQLRTQDGELARPSDERGVPATREGIGAGHCAEHPPGL